MSTDSPIPERWRTTYDLAQAGHDTLAPHYVAQVVEELGTAESLVRDLARALKTVPLKLRLGGFANTADGIDEIVSRIPKELQ